MAEKKGILSDIARGSLLGLQKSVKGVGETVTSAIDYFADTDLTKDLQTFFDNRMIDAPESTAGEIASFITQFGVPGLGAAGLISRANKFSNLQKALTFGVVDGAVATDDTTTILDAFMDNDSDEERLARLNGSEAAAARLMEKVNVAGEATAFVMGLPYAIKGVTGAVGGTLDAVSPVAAKVIASSGLAKKTTKVKDFEGEMTEQTLGLWEGIKNAFSVKGVGLEGPVGLISSEGLPNTIVAQAKAQKTAIANHNVEMVNNNIKTLEKTISQLDLSQTQAMSMARSIEDALFPQIRVSYKNPGITNPDEIKKLAMKVRGNARRNITNIEKRMTKTYENLGIDDRLKVSNIVRDMRDQVDDMSREILDLRKTDEKAFNALLTEEGLKDSVARNIGIYGTRVYKAFMDDGAFLKNLDPKLKQEAINEIKKVTGFDDNTADYVWRSISSRGRSSATNKDFTGFETAEFISEGLSKAQQGILKGRTLNNLPAVRRALGEVSGYLQSTPEQALANTGLVAASTISKLSSIIGKTKVFQDIKLINDIGPTQLGTKQFLKDKEFLKGAIDVGPNRFAKPSADGKTEVIYKQFGDNFGALSGMVTREDFYNAIAKTTTSFEQNHHVLMKAYAPMLALKSISQYGKTVGSPLAQVRNNTSIPFFALLNGNVGSTGKLADAYVNTFAGLIDPASRKLKSEVVEELTELGIAQRGGSAIFGELKRNAEIAFDAAPGFGRVVKGVKEVPGIKQTTDFAEEVYKMTDDTARVFNYFLEKPRFKNALNIIRADKNLKPGAEFVPVESMANIKNFQNNITIGKNGGAVLDIRRLTDDQVEAFARAETAELTLNTVQNYQRVVPIVRDGISRLPIGNFTAFPAEMIRNGTNSLHRAIRELASESPELQKIGMRRLAGAITAGGGFGAGITAAGAYLTGVTYDQIKAFQRQGTPWEETATMVPVGSDEFGNPTEFFNFSYMNPYDLFRRPALRILAEVEEGNRNEESLTKILLDSTFEGSLELITPFIEPAFGINAINDAIRGETGTGRRIWRDGDTVGDKALKGFLYSIDTVLPSATPITFEEDAGNLYYVGARLKDGPKSVINFTKNGVAGKGGKGQELDVGETMLQAFSGIKTVKPQLDTTLLYRAYEANEAIRDSSNEFNNYLNSGNVGEKEAQNYTLAFIRANSDRYNALRNLYQTLDDTRLLGMTLEEQQDILKKAKITNYDEVLMKRFQPIEPDQEKIFEQQLKGKDIDPLQLERIFEQLKLEDLEGRYRGNQLGSVQSPSTQIRNNQNQDRVSVALRQAEIDKLLGIN